MRTYRVVIRRLLGLRRRWGVRKVVRLLLHRPGVLRDLAEFDLDSIRRDQAVRFGVLGIDYAAAVAAVAGVVGDSRRRDSSEHYTLFAGWLILNPHSRILEVGTDTGRFAGFLSDVAPQSEIVTVDLPASDQRYRNATIRCGDSQPLHRSIPAERSAYLERTNVRFIEMNSLELIGSSQKFDAIWLDGDHTNPVVTLDIGQVVRLLKPGGLLAMDDVRLPGAWAGVHGSTETHVALEALQDAGLIRYELIHKRITETQLLLRETRKFIAVVKRVERADPLI